MDKKITAANKDFGRYVQEGRLRLGYTQDQLAELCDISKDQIQNIEINKRKPSFETLVVIMTTLSLSFDRFVFETNTNNEAEILVDRVRVLPNEDVQFVHDSLNALESRVKQRGMR